MPTLVQIQCPHCQALMKLKSRAPLGKQVPCPKCQTPFVAKEKRAAEQPVDDYDEYDEYEDYEPAEEFATEDDFQPRPKRNSGGKKRSSKAAKSKNSGKGLKLGLIIGGSVLGVVLVGLTIWLIVGMFNKKLDLAWLPEDADRIIVVRVSEVWESKFVQDDVKDNLKKSIAAMNKKWGLEPKDIESVTTGRSGGDMVIVVRTHIAMDAEKIAKNGGDYKEVEHEGKTYYSFPGGTALYFHDDRTSVAGRESSVRKAIERGPKAKARDDLKWVDGSSQIVQVAIRDDEKVGLKTIANAKGYSYSSGFKMIEQHRFDNAESAKEFADGVEEHRQTNREAKVREIRESMIMTEDEKKRDLDALEAMSSRCSRSGDVVTFNVNLPVGDSKGRKRVAKRIEDPLDHIERLVRSPNELFGIPGYVPVRRAAPPRRTTPRPSAPPVRNRARASANRVYVLELELRENGKEQAAADALRNVASIDASRTKVAGNQITIYSRPGQRISLTDVFRKLRAAGLRPPRLRRSRTE